MCCEWDLSVRLPLVVIFSGFRIAKCYRDSPWHVFLAWVLMVFITSPLLVLLSPFSFLDLVSSVIFYTSFFYPVFSSFLSPSLHNLSLFLPLLPLIPTFPLSFVLFYTSYFLSQFSAFLSSLPHNLPLFPPLPPRPLSPSFPFKSPAGPSSVASRAILVLGQWVGRGRPRPSPRKSSRVFSSRSSPRAGVISEVDRGHAVGSFHFEGSREDGEGAGGGGEEGRSRNYHQHQHHHHHRLCLVFGHDLCYPSFGVGSRGG